MDNLGKLKPSTQSHHHQQQQRPWPCPYADCTASFRTQTALTQHKIDTAEHTYCKTCDADCEDWQALHRHKVRSSAHVCCPGCGRDFASVGGMMRHVRLDHRRPAAITCVACEQRFGSGFAFIDHMQGNAHQKARKMEFEPTRSRHVVGNERKIRTEDTTTDDKSTTMSYSSNMTWSVPSMETRPSSVKKSSWSEAESLLEEADGGLTTLAASASSSAKGKGSEETLGVTAAIDFDRAAMLRTDLDKLNIGDDCDNHRLASALHKSQQSPKKRKKWVFTAESNTVVPKENKGWSTGFS